MAEAILFATGEDPIVCTLAAKSYGELVKLVGSGEPRVYVVRDTDLAHFARSAKSKGCQRQARGKQLHEYVVRNAEVRFIYSYQVSAGRLRKSVEELRDEAANAGFCKLYVVGARTCDTREESRWQDLNPKYPKANRDVFSALEEKVEDQARVRPSRESELKILGDSPAIRRLRREVRETAKHDESVLLLGETGSGKTMIARVLHDASPRKSAPFIPINSPALNREVYHTDFHGVVKNYPGFHNKEATIGLLEQADGGTLFLDEVGDLLPEVQAQLLVDLEAQVVKKLGSSNEKPVDFRVIAATDRNLPELVERDRFRKQLFHRLSANIIVIPPLRDCMDDLETIAGAVWKRAVAEEGFKATRESGLATIPDALLEEFKEYDWPGNFRDLDKFTKKLVRARIYGEETDLAKLFKILLEEESWEGYRGDRGGALGRLPVYQRIEEALRRAQEAVRPVFVEEEADEKTRARVQVAVRGHIKTLEALCFTRSLSNDSEIRQLVVEAGKVLRKFSHLVGGMSGWREMWSDEVESQFSAAQNLLRSQIEQAAAELHRNYIETLRRVDEGADPVPYDELPSDLRESNRQQFLWMPKIFRAFGYWMRPARLEEIRDPDLSEQHVEEMARLEHDRWIEERKEAGWTYAKKKNIAARHSPYLVPWDDLPDDIKQFDLDAVRSFPRILKGMSIEIYKPS